MSEIDLEAVKETIATELGKIEHEREDLLSSCPVKYRELMQDMLRNADAVASNYEGLARRYMDMASKIRAQGVSTAKQHIDDLLALDTAEQAIDRHYKQAPDVKRISNGTGNGNGKSNGTP